MSAVQLAMSRGRCCCCTCTSRSEPALTGDPFDFPPSFLTCRRHRLRSAKHFLNMYPYCFSKISLALISSLCLISLTFLYTSLASHAPRKPTQPLYLIALPHIRLGM